MISNPSLSSCHSHSPLHQLCRVEARCAKCHLIRRFLATAVIVQTFSPSALLYRRCIISHSLFLLELSFWFSGSLSLFLAIFFLSSFPHSSILMLARKPQVFDCNLPFSSTWLIRVNVCYCNI
jgi:hypothetical protein